MTSAIERAIEKYRNEVDGYKSEAKSEEAQTVFDTTQEILDELKYILKEEQSNSSWIPVEERLPGLVGTADRLGKKYWVIYDHGPLLMNRTTVAYFVYDHHNMSVANKRFYCPKLGLLNVTHWQTLPEVPKGEPGR